MKRNFFNMCLFVVIILLQISCSVDFEPNINVQPIAVLNVLVENDSTVSASVTRTWRFADNKQIIVQDDADVYLSVNGEDMGQMQFNAESGKYCSSYIAKQGDIISIKADTRNYGSAVGKTVVPKIVPIESFTCSAARVTDYDGFEISPDGSIKNVEALDVYYKITFTDPGDEDNYYMIGSSINGENEPLLKEHDEALDEIFLLNEEFNVFTDKSINGRTYTLTLSSRIYHWNLRYMVDTIKLYSISYDYYLYMLSIYRKYCGINGQLESVGIANPKDIYTNVSPGVGIVAASSFDMVQYDKTDDVKRLFPEWIQ